MERDHGWISATAQRLEAQLDGIRISPPPDRPILGPEGAPRPVTASELRQEIEGE